MLVGGWFVCLLVFWFFFTIPVVNILWTYHNLDLLRRKSQKRITEFSCVAAILEQKKRMSLSTTPIPPKTSLLLSLVVTPLPKSTFNDNYL